MLDAIGEGVLLRYSFVRAETSRLPAAAFDYQFGALTDAETPLSKAYFGLM